MKKSENVKGTELKKTKGWHALLGVVIAVSLILIFLISSFEIGAYADYGFYEKEYEKYQVADELYMEMPDIMEVTRYMMSYLRGGEETLSIETTVEGSVRDFFNEQDRLHMKDVQDLFLGGLMLRRIAGILLAAAAALLVWNKADWRTIIPKMYQRTLAVFLALVGVLGVLLSRDFTKYFEIFHQIFFDNDLWIFDPAEDYMIRMLPEGFFYDMVMRIGGIFIALLLGFLALTAVWRIVNKRNKNSL